MNLLREYVLERKERASEFLGVDLPVYGVNRKDGLTPVAKYQSKDLSRYKVIRSGMFSYNPMRLNIGSIAYCKDSHPTGLVSPDYVVFSCNETMLDHNFMKYAILGPEWNHWTLSAGVGSVRIRIYFKELATMPFDPPPLPEQKMIAHILGSLDDKIELTRQMNATLQSMAQTLFKSWFVDFDPVIDNALAAGNKIPDVLKTKAAIRKDLGDVHKPLPEAICQQFPDSFEYDEDMGWIPEGWEVSSIDKECSFQNGYAFKSKELLKEPDDSTYHVFKMGNINRGGGFNYEGTKSYYLKEKSQDLDKYIIKKGDILMAMTDMKSSMALLAHTALMSTDSVFLLNQRVGRIRVKSISILNYPYFYVYSNLKQTIDELRKRSNSGVQVNLSTSEIKKTKILIPNKESHDLFDDVAFTNVQKSFSNEAEIQNLTKLRNTLLPKLLSGELRIPNAEKLIQDAI